MGRAAPSEQAMGHAGLAPERGRGLAIDRPGWRKRAAGHGPFPVFFLQRQFKMISASFFEHFSSSFNSEQIILFREYKSNRDASVKE